LVLVLLIDICAALDEKFGNSEMAVGGCEVEGSAGALSVQIRI
jgi:hypothetical protein